MAQAKRTRDIPEWEADKAKKKRAASRKAKTKDKAFEDLSDAEKDALLKALGVAAGLIKDSDDS